MQAIVLRRRLRARPEYRGRMMVEISIAFPKVITKGLPSGGEISSYYSDRASAYYTWCTRVFFRAAVQEYQSSRKNGVPFHAFSAVSNFMVPYNDDFLSIYTDNYQFTGGAHGYTTRTAETWDLKTGRQVRLGDLFIAPGYESKLFQSITEQIISQSAKGKNIYFDNWQENIFKYFDDRNFYLTPEGLALFFPLYSIAPYASGIVTFIVSWAELKDNMRISMDALKKN